MRSPRSRTPRSTSSSRRAAPRSSRAARASTSEPRWPTSRFRRRGDPGARQRIEREVDADRAAAHRRSREARPGIRRGGSPERSEAPRPRARAGGDGPRRSSPGRSGSGAAQTRRPTLICGLDGPERRPRATDPGARGCDVRATGSSRRCGPRSRSRSRGRRRRRSGSPRSRSSSRRRRSSASSSGRAATPPTSGSGCRRIPGSSRSTASGPPERWRRDRRSGAAVACRSDALREVACARQRVPGRRAGGCRRAHPERVRRLCDDATGIGSHGVLEVDPRDDAHADVVDLEPGRLRGGDVRQRRPDRRTVARREGAGSPRS